MAGKKNTSGQHNRPFCSRCLKSLISSLGTSHNLSWRKLEGGGGGGGGGGGEIGGP